VSGSWTDVKEALRVGVRAFEAHEARTAEVAGDAPLAASRALPSGAGR
jgi:hypothetical protein